MKKIILGTTLLATLLSGCESMSPAECASVNWRDKGVQDGREGQRDRTADYQESCAKAGLRVDAESYRAGRTTGLQGYCRLDNAINEGLAGRSYQNVCPAAIDQKFRVFHSTAEQTQQARKKLEDLKNEQKQWERELLDEKTPPKRKTLLRDQLARSDRRIDEAREELRAAEYRLERVRYELRQQGGL